MGDGEPNCDGRGAKGLPRGCTEAVGCEVADIVLKMALGYVWGGVFRYIKILIRIAAYLQLARSRTITQKLFRKK